MPPEKRHRILSQRWADSSRDTQQSRREMRHGKRLLEANTRARGMETVFTAVKDLTILDVFFSPWNNIHTGVLQ